MDNRVAIRADRAQIHNRIDLVFPLQALSNYDYCKQPAGLARLERELEDLTKRKWCVRVEMEAGVRVQPSGDGPPPGVLSRQAREDRLRQIPLTNRILEKLGARVLQIDDGFGNEPDIAANETPAEEL